MKNKKLSFFLIIISIFITGCFSNNPDNSDNPSTPIVGEYQRGEASWYGAEYDGRETASGEVFDRTLMTAAHRSLSFGTYVEVTNLDNGRRTIVKINDRGPFVAGRIIDVSERAADVLGMKIAGIAQVSLKITNDTN